MTDKERAKDKCITSYLLSQGYKAIRGRSTGKHDVYLSMLHLETEPSFFVDKGRNKWRDYGFGGTKWDDVLTLVMKIEGKTFSQAINTLLGKEDIIKREHSEVEFKPGIVVDEVGPLRDYRLLKYLKGRGVDCDLAKLYCEEALVRFPSGVAPDKRHLYISFKNDKGGYELRNQYSVKIGKVSSSPKYFTRFPGKEGYYNLFEGFLDYLTMLSRYRVEKFKNTVVVLNSLVNITYLYQTLKKNEENNLFLDNGIAADKYISKGDSKMNIKSLKELEIDYIDRRYLFPCADDINDYKNGKLKI